jgi:CRISPR-associated protein Cas5d
VTRVQALPGNPVSVKVWGPFACFTRPEFGVERVSYPTMTPTAAVGLLDAIFWKPEFRWRIVAIDTLRPVQWIQVRRNEITSRQTAQIAKRWADGDDDGFDVAATNESGKLINRAQRAGLLLTDVGYVVHAEVALLAHSDAHPAKYRDQLRRRVTRGQCFERPYLGCREFSAQFADPENNDCPIEWDEDLGPMIHSVYTGSNDHLTPAVAKPLFFDARVRAGRLSVPPLPAERR